MTQLVDGRACRRQVARSHRDLDLGGEQSRPLDHDGGRLESPVQPHPGGLDAALGKT